MWKKAKQCASTLLRKRMNIALLPFKLIRTMRPSRQHAKNKTVGVEQREGWGEGALDYLFVFKQQRGRRFWGGGWSSISTPKLWVIKGCLFRNQNLLLDGPLHLVPITSLGAPLSHMLNSTHVWELHHITAHVFVPWCAALVLVCVQHVLQHTCTKQKQLKEFLLFDIFFENRRFWS